MSRRPTFGTAIALGALFVPSLAALQVVARAANPATGFAQPYAGTPKYQQYAPPTEATSAGMLMSLANTDAPTRKVNVVLKPGGYLGKWCRQNGGPGFTPDALPVGLYL